MVKVLPVLFHCPSRARVPPLLTILPMLEGVELTGEGEGGRRWIF